MTGVLNVTGGRRGVALFAAHDTREAARVWTAGENVLVANGLLILTVYDVGCGMTLLHWALIFLVIAIIAAIFGFVGIAAAAAWVAKVLFIIFIVIFLILLILHLMHGGRHGPP